LGVEKFFQKHLEAIKIQEKKGNLKLIAVCDQKKIYLKSKLNLG
jgi:hypothetical protein